MIGRARAFPSGLVERVTYAVKASIALDGHVDHCELALSSDDVGTYLRLLAAFHALARDEAHTGLRLEPFGARDREGRPVGATWRLRRFGVSFACLHVPDELADVVVAEAEAWVARRTGPHS